MDNPHEEDRENRESNGDNANQDSAEQHTPFPPAPNPSADPGVIPQINPNEQPNVDEPSIPGPELSVATMEPVAAMKLLSRAIQVIADMTGDIPPTPPISRPGTPSSQQIRKELLGRPRTPSRPGTPNAHIPSDDVAKLASSTSLPIGAPEAHPFEHTDPNVDASTCSPPSSTDPTSTSTRTSTPPLSTSQQRAAIARKFYSKKPPPVPIADYLARLHRYCPMSTGVYIAAGRYVHRLALLDRSVPVTSRTVHRLLLAALRVAMKALEDLSYPHKRFAGVGGVGERELAKLEVSLCYLMEFGLRVGIEGLVETAGVLREIGERRSAFPGGVKGMALSIPVRERGRSRRGSVV